MAILDFGMSVNKHVKGKGLARIGHAIKDAFDANMPEFQAKKTRIDDLKAKILEDSQTAYQEKTLGTFDKMGNSLDSLGESLEAIHQSIADIETGKMEMKEMFDELKQLAKHRPTIEELAQQEFEKTRNSLEALPSSLNRYMTFKEQRHANTCDWIFTNEAYMKWHESKNSLLWIRGDNGTGKSVLMSAIYDKLRDECKEDSTLQYVSCDSGDGTVPSAKTIQNTILAQVYDVAQVDDKDSTLLQRANAAFKNPKKDRKDKKEKNSKAHASRDKKSEMFDFYDVLESLLGILNRSLFLVVDTVDFLTNEEQTALISALDDIRDFETSTVHIVVASRPEGGISSYLNDNSDPQIEQLKLGHLNSNDILTVLGNKLKAMPGWSHAEQEEAMAAVVAKTGSNFKYLSDVALPYLQQPFPRPISKHLKNLPDSFHDDYNRAIDRLSANYWELLKTALTWTLCADPPVTVNEIMDAYMGTYAGPEADGALDNDNDPEGAESDPYITPQLYIDQLNDAGSTFLDIENNIVTLKDFNSTWDYCIGEKGETYEDHPNGIREGICPTCHDHGASRRIHLSEKEGHMQLALTMFRHINSKKFKSRFFHREDESEASSEAENAKNGSETNAENEKLQEDENETTEGAEKANSAVNGVSDDVKASEEGEKVDSVTDSPEVIPDDKAAASASNGAATDADGHEERNGHGIEKDQEQSNEEEIQTEDTDPDMSMDSEDQSQPGQDGDAYADQASDDSRALRYEIVKLFWHARKVEELLTPAEKILEDDMDLGTESQRPLNQDWKTLQNEIYKFIVESDKFKEWRLLRFPYENSEWTPVAAGALYGLTSLLERYLDEVEDPKAVLHELFDDKYNALDIALETSDRLDTVQLLLEKGSDPNHMPDVATFSTFQYGIGLGASFEYVDMLLKHGASCTQKDNEFDSVALHRFALSGDDTRILDLLLKNPYDASNSSDINAKDVNDETPLHYIMARPTVPIELLKAFLDNGADVDADTKTSERPLGEAAQYGETEALKLIIEKVKDTDDDNDYGRTALHGAAWGGQKNTIVELLSHGADIVRTDKHDRTPFFFACLGLNQTGESTYETAHHLLNVMIEKNIGIDQINKPTKTKRTPLREAAAHGLDKIVETILSKSNGNKEIMNLQDTRKKRTALHCAALHGNSEAVRLLQEAGADLTLKDYMDRTALDLCRERWAFDGSSNFEKTACHLIDGDPTAAAQDRELLSIAAMNGSVPVLEKLLDANAPFNTPDEHGWTPLLIAKQYQQTAATNFLAHRLARSWMSPSSWLSTSDEVSISDDGLRITFTGDGPMCVTANHPVAAGSNEYYFEVHIPEEQTEHPSQLLVGVGFSTTTGKFQEFPGWKSKFAPAVKSWAHHSDDGGYFHQDHASALGRGMGSAIRLVPGWI